MRTLSGLVLLAITTAPTVGAVAIHAMGEDTTTSLQQRQQLPPCYSPSGDLNDGFYACDIMAQVSRCCPVGYTCSGSALCVLVVEPLEPKPPDLVTVTATVAVVRKSGACTDLEWDGENCGGGYLDTRDKEGNLSACGAVETGKDERLCRSGGSHPGTCSCSSNGGRFTVAAEEAQTVLGGRNHVGSPDISSSLVVATTMDAGPMWLPTTTVAVVVPATSSTLDMPHKPGDDGTRTPAPVPANTQLTSSISSTLGLGGTEAGSNVKTMSTPAFLLPSSTWATQTVTTSLIAPSSSSTTNSKTSQYQAPTTIPTIPTIPSQPDTNPDTTAALATKLGLGLGIPTLVLLVLAITACTRRRQRKRQRQNLYNQAPPFDFTAPEMPPVTAADLSAEQYYRYGLPRSIVWSEWGPAAGGGGEDDNGNGNGNGNGAGLGSYDDSQVGYVGPLGFEGYHQGYQARCEAAGSPESGHQSQYQEQPRGEEEGEHQDIGVTAESASPYDGQDRVYDVVPALQIPTVRVQKPEQAPQGYQCLSVRVSSGSNGCLDEVSPLSSSGSGPPYTRVSAMSALAGTEETQKC